MAEGEVYNQCRWCDKMISGPKAGERLPGPIYRTRDESGEHEVGGGICEECTQGMTRHQRRRRRRKP